MASGVKVGSAYVEVVADADGAFKGVGKQAEAEGGKSGGLFKGAFGKSMLGLGAMIGGAFAVDKVFGFVGSAINSASDLNEEISKSDAIFGKSSAGLQSWAQNAAKNVGLSEQQALSATGTFGNMFTQIGFGQSEAAGLSKEVVTLSADLGSFNNLETADVADRMNAAFRGEYDSIQALLPGINAATVEQRALEMSGKDSAAALTQQEKAMAVLSLANEGGANAQGDFAKTQEGLAGQTKIAKAQFDDLTATIGSYFLPAATAVMSFVNTNLIPALQSIGSWISTDVVPAFNSFKQAIMDNLPTIQLIASIIGAILLPALIRSAIQITLTAATHVAGWVAMSLGATVNAAKVVAAWVLMGVQSMLQAARMAAAWVIAMGPIGWIITAIVGLVVLIIANWDTIKAVTIAVFTNVMQFFSDTWNNIVSFVTTYINAMVLVITTTFNNIKQFFTDVWNNIKLTFQVVWDAIKATISNVINGIRDTISNVFNGIKGFFSNTWNNVKNITTTAWDNLKNSVRDGVNNAVDLVKSLPQKAMDALGDLGSKLKNSGAALIQGFKDGITNAFGSVKDVVTGGLQMIRDLFPFSPAKEGPFSGKGYTTHSGKALAVDFAKSIEAQKRTVQSAAASLLGGASSTLNSTIGVSGVGASTTTRPSNGIISNNNVYHITIDAKNVKEFNDVVDIIQNIPQVARTGRGTGATARIA